MQFERMKKASFPGWSLVPGLVVLCGSKNSDSPRYQLKRKGSGIQ
jgi:hypothetical protein